MLATVLLRMHPRMQDQNLFGETAILAVPVPLHRSKIRERGFNQADLIARAALKDPDLAKRFKLEAGVLRRRRITKSQIGLTQNQRRENLRGAFIVPNPEKVSGRRILLIDDVFTTGTTASACARVLMRAGASQVWVATVARTLKRVNQMSAQFKPPIAMAG